MATVSPDTLGGSRIPDGKPVEAPLWYRLGRRLWEYALLTRLNRPIGIWLLMWPTLWALWIAGEGQPDERLLIVFVLGTVVMRSAGCIINDFTDRNVDPHVARTRERPLAARRVSPYEALTLFGVLIGFALWLVTRLDWFTVQLACVGAVLTVTYPLFKRFFPLPQLYLGLAFGWGVPMAFAAQTGALPRMAWLLFLVAIVWATIYDTLYAMADREDDLKIGVKSSAILFGDLDRVIVGVLQALMLFGLVLAGQSLDFGAWYYGGVAAGGLFFLYQQWIIRNREPARCFQAFLNNHFVGMVVFIGILLEYVFTG